MEAYEYMSYETLYCILDVRDRTEYERSHVDSAVNLPVSEIVERADEVIPDRNMMIYIYGSDSDESCSAAQKLSDMGFTSVTETGSYQDWIRLRDEVHS